MVGLARDGEARLDGPTLAWPPQVAENIVGSVAGRVEVPAATLSSPPLPL